MKSRRVLLSIGRPFFATLAGLGCLLTTSGSAVAQGRPTDTLRVVNASINPGDTGDVYVYLVNAEPLGGYTFRVRFDHRVLGVVTIPGNDSTVQHLQLRGDFSLRGAALRDTDAVTFTAVFPSSPAGMEPGRGNAVRFRFFAKPDMPLGTVSEMFFEDAPYDSNAYNWFSHYTGLYQYRPTRVSGFIAVGEATSLLISCPGSTILGCDEDPDPMRTGRALASDPQATVTYQDETIPGSCAGESTIRRRWTAARGEQDTSCMQIISMRDTLAPAVSCPPTKNIEFAIVPDPTRTGYPIVTDNCDPLPNVTYNDTETPGTYPIHRVITRSWTATDACGNHNLCRQTVRELADGVPDTTTIPDGDETGLILHPLWPNPFHIGRDSVDSIRFAVSSAGRVNISIYDVTGRRLKTVCNEQVNSVGTHTTTWNGRDAAGNYVPSGVYLCRLEQDGKAVKQKVAVIR